MRRVLPAGAILLIVTTLPYVWCWWRSPADAEFSGALAYPDAFNTDLGWMRQVQDGHFLLTNIYDHHPPRHVFLNGFWSPLGLVARLTGVALLGIFHLARWGSSLLLVWILWVGLRGCVRDTTVRRFLFIFLVFGGGFGWLLAGVSWCVLGRPILAYDLWSAFYPFMEMLLSAHVPASHALVLAAGFLWARGEKRQSLVWFVLAGVVVALLATFHPYQVPVIWLGLLIYACWTAPWSENRRFRALLLRLTRWIWLVLIPLPVLVYFAWLLRDVEGFASWRSQPTGGPPLWSVPFHMGPLMLIALWAWRDLRETVRIKLAHVCGALFLSDLLIVHSPISFSWARQADISLISLGVLFLAPALETKWRRIREHRSSVSSKRFLVVVFVLSLGDSPVLLAKRTAAAQREFPFQVPVSLLKVLHAVDRQSDFTIVVLSDPEIGSLIPRYAGARSLLGHPHVASDYNAKAAAYQSILEQPSNTNSRDEFLRKYNISYWITTPRSDPAAQDLPLLFEAGEYRLRAVGGI